MRKGNWFLETEGRGFNLVQRNVKFGGENVSLVKVKFD